MRRRRALRLAGGCGLGALAGCVTRGRVFETYQYETTAPNDNPSGGPWRTWAYNARRSGYNPAGQLPPQPSVDVFDYPRQPFEMQPAFIGGVAYFGARQSAPEHSGRFGPSGLKATDGQGNGWFFPENDTLASPTIAGDAIFVTSDGVTRALDRRDGRLCWAYHEGMGATSASPTVVDDTVYVTGERLFALDAATGEVQWAATAPDARLYGTAATENGVFAIGGRQGRGMVYRYDLETGREEWATTTSSEVHIPPILGEFVFVVTADGWLLALDRSDGSEAWSRDLGGRSSALPALAEGTIHAVATTGDTLTAFDAATGQVQWEFEFIARTAIGPTIGGETVYLPTTIWGMGIVYAIELDTGVNRGVFTLPQPPTTPLVVGYGEGLVGTSTGGSTTRLLHLQRPTPSD